MNGEVFIKLLSQRLIPYLPANTVEVIDNTSYITIGEFLTISSTKKCDDVLQTAITCISTKQLRTRVVAITR
jgi:hypothetical protein